MYSNPPPHVCPYLPTFVPAVQLINGLVSTASFLLAISANSHVESRFCFAVEDLSFSKLVTDDKKNCIPYHNEFALKSILDDMLTYSKIEAKSYMTTD